MLVEDEGPLLLLLERHLKRLGFDVDAHSTATGALSALAAARDSYNLVVADMGLPDMPGDALLAKMFELCPDLRVLICSGSEFFVSSLPEAIQQRVAFLQKPFAPKELGQKIDDMLARPGA